MPDLISSDAAPPAALRHAIVDTTLGSLLVAATDEAVAFIALADTADEVRDALAKRFPRARIEDADTRMREWADAVATVVESGDPGPIREVPVRLTGTPFQEAVWTQLAAIPRGTTITYGELARRVGRPSAVRAVAQACGANPVGVLVPCHRVIGADGSLTGFASGIDRKRTLLEREGAL